MMQREKIKLKQNMGIPASQQQFLIVLISTATQGTLKSTMCSNDIKGTVQRDFSTPVFFTKRLVLVPIDMPKSNFEFCQIFVELFVLKISKY